MDSSLAKKCTKCGELKSLVNFYSKIKTNGKSRIESWCKGCYSFHKKSLSPTEVPKEIKICSVCDSSKHFTEFSKNGRSKDGLMAHCKPCKKAIDLESNLNRKYGITTDTFNSMKEEQGNKCQICFLEKQLVVDHCHNTGRVRGLLCHQCNTLIGFSKEDDIILKRAGEYVRRYS